MPIEAGPGLQTYAGALVRRGEAVAEVTATGTRTKFGRTAELVRTAHVVSSQQKVVFRVVRNLTLFNSVIIVFLVTYAYAVSIPLREIVPLILTAVLASIPVALPATFTLAAAIGAKGLAKVGVLPTRLSAVDEAATMDVLCVDKTGTLTQNALTVTVVQALEGFDEAHILGLAALAVLTAGRIPWMWQFARPHYTTAQTICRSSPSSSPLIRRRRCLRQWEWGRMTPSCGSSKARSPSSRVSQ